MATKSPRPPERPVVSKPVLVAIKPKPIIESPAEPAKPAEALDAPSEDQSAIFRAVGIIAGIVTFDEDNRARVAFGGKEYNLLYAGSHKHKQAFAGLRKEIEKTGQHQQRLIVYPKILHFPRREQPHMVSFQLVGFDVNGDRYSEGITKDLADFEFRLAGLWQFIPVCQTPCISVFKNFSHERLDAVKARDAQWRARFMKASHIPLFWKNAPIRPFRFNPKLEADQQGRPSFVEIKALFLPQSDVFGFKSLVSQPAEEAPKFFKLRKADKAIALQAKKQRRTGLIPPSKQSSIRLPVK